MKSLSFQEGLESFKINGDKNRVIHFNPADPELINRFLNLKNTFANYKPEHDLELNPDGTPKNELEKEAAYIAEFTSAMRLAINSAFNADIYDVIFNGQSPLCIVGENYLFENVFDGLMGIMGEAIDAYNKKSPGKMDKYLKDLKK